MAEKLKYENNFANFIRVYASVLGLTLTIMVLILATSFSSQELTAHDCQISQGLPPAAWERASNYHVQYILERIGTLPPYSNIQILFNVSDTRIITIQATYTADTVTLEEITSENGVAQQHRLLGQYEVDEVVERLIQILIDNQMSGVLIETDIQIQISDGGEFVNSIYPQADPNLFRTTSGFIQIRYSSILSTGTGAVIEAYLMGPDRALILALRVIPGSPRGTVRIARTFDVPVGTAFVIEDATAQPGSQLRRYLNIVNCAS